MVRWKYCLFSVFVFSIHVSISSAGFRSWKHYCSTDGVDAIIHPRNGIGVPLSLAVEFPIVVADANWSDFFCCETIGVIQLVWGGSIPFARTTVQRGQLDKVSSGRGLNLVAARLCAWRFWFGQDVHLTRRRTAWVCRSTYCNTLNMFQRYCLRDCNTLKFLCLYDLMLDHSHVCTFPSSVGL